jgi:hypothetical protein
LYKLQQPVKSKPPPLNLLLSAGQPLAFDGADENDPLEEEPTTPKDAKTKTSAELEEIMQRRSSEEIFQAILVEM